MKEHEPGCPRLQFWDASEHDAPCMCGLGPEQKIAKAPPLLAEVWKLREVATALAKYEHALGARARCLLMDPGWDEVNDAMDSAHDEMLAALDAAMPGWREA